MLGWPRANLQCDMQKGANCEIKSQRWIVWVPDLDSHDAFGATTWRRRQSVPSLKGWKDMGAAALASATWGIHEQGGRRHWPRFSRVFKSLCSEGNLKILSTGRGPKWVVPRNGRWFCLGVRSRSAHSRNGSWPSSGSRDVGGPGSCGVVKLHPRGTPT